MECQLDQSQKGKIGIVGSGLIGRSWAMLYASVGYSVVIYELHQTILDGALEFIKNELTSLERCGGLRGTLNAKQQIVNIRGTISMPVMVKDSVLIQECIPEVLPLKKKLYAQLDALIADDTILSSSTSTYIPTQIAEGLKHREQVIIAHPVNPPYYVPLVEVVASPWTKHEVTKQTMEIMTEIGQKPVLLAREIPGFALNRIQFAVLNEVFRLVKDGVLNVRDIDCVMSEGLGMRYAFLGALETAHLNADGMANYFERYGNVFEGTKTLNATDEANISDQLNKICPIAKIPDRRAWRDVCLLKLSQLKREMNK